MNEHTARDVVLVRAIETADQNKEILGDDDRTYASRSARELAQWQASGNKAEASVDDFLQQRAGLILKRLAERTPAFAAVTKQRHSLKAFCVAMPIIALLLGAGLDRISDPHRVDLLSPPLLLIIAWNVFVYLSLLAWRLMPTRTPGWLSSALTRKPRLPRKLPQALSSAVLNFATEWMQLSAKLATARLSSTIHLSAATFAIGALASLYARGIWSQYAAGWESTFLDAGQVHALLSFLFAPAVAVFHLQDFSLAEITALRFPQTTAAEGGARWVHLYAATILLLVVLPRMSLATFGGWRAARLTRRFPIDLDQPYFRKLGASIGMAGGGTLRVLPYSFTVDEARHKGLADIAVMLFGEQGRMMLRPSIAYGAEPGEILRDTDLRTDTTAALFNLAATPEKENHGALLDYLVTASAREIMVLLDESAYLERLGDQPEARARLAERTALWQQFCAFHQAKASVVNLLAPSLHELDLHA